MIEAIAVRQEGERVLLIKDGRLIVDLPYQAALDLAKALRIKGKLAEELSEANGIIRDQALLIRIGAKLGLTRRRDIMKEAIKEAEHDRDLRRYLPGGIKSTAIVGTPTVIGGSR
jgi:hypothetical protein